MLGITSVNRMLIDEYYTVILNSGDIVSGICQPQISPSHVFILIGKIKGNNLCHAIPISEISMVLSLPGLEIMCELGELE